MNKIFSFMVFFLLLAGFTANAQDMSWTIYINKKFGYQIQYPSQATRLTSIEDIRQGFYFDPLQPIADLKRQSGFAGIAVVPHSLVKISFPDKYLIILTIEGVAKDAALPSPQATEINGHQFYRQHTQEAGMCHYYDYHTYYLKNADKYFVFIFLVPTSCNTETKDHKHVNLNILEFEKILASFKLLQ